MKTSLRLVWMLVALFACTQAANSQQFAIPDGGVNGPAYGGNSVYEPGAFQATSGDIGVGLPGRIWFSSSFADRGLGYEGGFLTLGAKTRLFNDGLDGRWLGEVRAHYSYENGRFFGNLGVERVISIKQAGADVSLGGWIDYDDDAQDDFGHTFTQLGVSGSIKTRNWDLVGNAYFPFETQDFEQVGTIDPFFLGNSILLSPGTDSALGGFDALLKFRPRGLARVNGTVSIGGYGYGSELLDHVGGVRFRTGMQLMNNLLVNAEINYDDRFETTGVLSLGWVWGLNARGTEYSPLGRDLERTNRNDHIVRFSDPAVLAINPDTGLAYNVIHVDNTADGSVEDGTRETPFNQLSDAQLASGENDIIFVQTGTGNSALINTGIELQNGQLLLGSGAEHLLPVQDGMIFQIGADNPALRPTIANINGGPVVTLADNNIVRGFNIDASGSPNGILAEGVNGGTIDQVSITTAAEDAIRINQVSGDFLVLDTDASISGQNGLLVELASSTTNIELQSTNFSDNDFSGVNFDGFNGESVSITNNVTNNNSENGVVFNNSEIDAVTITNSNANSNGETGILFSGSDVPSVVLNNNNSNSNGDFGLLFEDHDGQLIDISAGQNNDNGEDGLSITNFQNSSGLGVDVSIVNQIATGNDQVGINIEDGGGNLTFAGVNTSFNGSDGLRIADWTTGPGQQVSISRGTGAAVAVFSNNGGAGINVELNQGTQNLVINEVNANNNFDGLLVNTSGVGTQLNLDVVDNFTFSNNEATGISINAMTGSTIDLELSQSLGFTAETLNIVGNDVAGIQLTASGTGAESLIQANFDNLNVSGNIDPAALGLGITTGMNLGGDQPGTGLDVNSLGDGLIQLAAEDITLDGNLSAIVIFADNDGNSAEPNRFEFNRITVNNNIDTGLFLQTETNTAVELLVENSTFDNTFSNLNTQAGPDFNENQFVGAGTGISVITTGINSLTRVVLRENEVNQFDLGGISLIATGASELFVDVVENSLDFNGFGPGDGTLGTGDGILPFENGIDILSVAQARLTARVQDNVISNSFEFGLSQETLFTARIVALYEGNDFTGNDIAEDATNVGPLGGVIVDNNGIDINIQNGAMATTALSLSDNEFDVNTAVFTNDGPAGSLEVALDGLTNGPGFGAGNIGTPNTIVPLGFFDTELADVTALFEAAGFTN